MNENIAPVIALVTPGIIELLLNNSSMTISEAASILYNSRLYSLLEDEKMKLWRLSYLSLYDLLQEELETGSITFPEEQ